MWLAGSFQLQCSGNRRSQYEARDSTQDVDCVKQIDIQKVSTTPSANATSSINRQDQDARPHALVSIILWCRCGTPEPCQPAPGGRPPSGLWTAAAESVPRGIENANVAPGP